MGRCQPLADARKVRLVPYLKTPVELNGELTLHGDGELLRILFVNLIRNAIRYSPQQQAVGISVQIDNRDVVVTIRDHGPGIPQQYIDRVFDRYFRVPEDSSNFSGAGLGLTIVGSVAQLHGGSVQAANCSDGGCQFTVRLQIGRAHV